jgi:hypothetical protein
MSGTIPPLLYAFIVCVALLVMPLVNCVLKIKYFGDE